jgi:hypothetical protein
MLVLKVYKVYGKKKRPLCEGPGFSARCLRKNETTLTV